MIEALLEAFPGAELLEVEDDPFEGAVCTWGGCLHTDVLVLLDGRDDPWCLTHADDAALPKVVSTDRGIQPCQQCGRGSAQMLEDGTGIHSGTCTRNLMARRASGAKPKGAYARRGRR